jgi:hypothetical protein
VANGVQQWRTDVMPNSGAAMPSAVNTQAPVADVFSTLVRASKRTAATVDQDSLEKATELKARKNQDVAKPKDTIQGTHWLRQ